MNELLIDYLEDHRSQILEVWLTEAEFEAPKKAPVERGELPIIYLENVFDDILQILGNPNVPQLNGFNRLSDYLGHTLDCRTQQPHSLACLELLIAGYTAFMSVLNTRWDTAGEFTAEEHAIFVCKARDALTTAMHVEIQKCAACAGKPDCSFRVEGEALHALWIKEHPLLKNLEQGKDAANLMKN